MRIFKNNHIMVFADSIRWTDYFKFPFLIIKNWKYKSFIYQKKKFKDKVVRLHYLNYLIKIFGSKSCKITIKKDYLEKINNFYISISHKRQFYCFAISKNRVGIDIETFDKNYKSFVLPVELRGIFPKKEHELKLKWSILEAWLKKYEVKSWPKKLIVTGNKVNRDDFYFFINKYLVISVIY